MRQPKRVVQAGLDDVGEWLVFATFLMHKIDVAAVVVIRPVGFGLPGMCDNPFGVLDEDLGHFMDERPEQYGTWRSAVASAGAGQS